MRSRARSAGGPTAGVDMLADRSAARLAGAAGRRPAADRVAPLQTRRHRRRRRAARYVSPRSTRCSRRATMLPRAPPPRRRVAPSGDPAADLMIVADMPDPGDAEAGHLFAGETARAVRRDARRDGAVARRRIYLAPALARAIAAGRLDPATGEALAALMRPPPRAACSPRRVMLFGDERRCTALLGTGRSEARGGLRRA